MSEREVQVNRPELDAGIHPDVRRECDDAWAMATPWTRIRPLREGVDDPSGSFCVGSAGRFHLECRKPVEAVQYSTAHGAAQFYCEEHALLQNEWDIANYYSKPRPRPDPGPEWEAEVAKIMAKLTKKKKEREEPKEYDP